MIQCLIYLSNQLCDAVGPEITKSELVGYFVRLLKDTEAEVRTAASLRVTGVCVVIPKDMAVKQVLPCIKELVTDASQHVRGIFFFFLHPV